MASSPSTNGAGSSCRRSAARSRATSSVGEKGLDDVVRRAGLERPRDGLFAAVGGNEDVRQVGECGDLLQNVLAHLTVIGPRYGPVGPDALPSAFRKTVVAERRRTLAQAREDLEHTMVRDALGRQGSVPRAGGELGVTRQGLSKLMARFQIDRVDTSRDRSARGPSR